VVEADEFGGGARLVVSCLKRAANARTLAAVATAMAASAMDLMVMLCPWAFDEVVATS
jgi:hypothetical protein